MHLIKLISLSLLISFLGASDNNSLLSALKQQKLEIDRKKIELESDNLKFNWINQIIGSYSTTRFDERRGADSSSTLSITFDQPIFKSGGIYFAIQYAGANREFLRLSATLNEQNLIKDVISTWLDIKKFDLRIESQKFLLENAKIDVMRKQEQYESGFLDSSFLNQAVLSKNQLEKSLIDLESLRYSALMRFNSLSDLDYLKITPPVFNMVDKDSFIENSSTLREQNININRAKYLKRMTISSYLPTVSINAGYYDTKSSIDDAYSQIGLRVSIPLLDINRGRTIEIRQLEYLKSKITLQDSRLEETNRYQDFMKKIERLNKKVDISINSVKLYDSLLLSTQELFEAGEKTIYDVQTLSNSKQTIILEKQMYEIDIQNTLLELYVKMYDKI